MTFDIEKARAFEQCQEYEHCKAGEIIEAACEEIERLRAENAIMKSQKTCSTRCPRSPHPLGWGGIGRSRKLFVLLQ